jgi:hypothetical protein
MRMFSDVDIELDGWQIDALLERYILWREECRAVSLAYSDWDHSERADRHLAYASYIAALDREEHAASSYAAQIERIKRFAI